MAGSRLEKIGTIYTRTTGLIRSGALRWEDRPIWYDIYEAFPPKEEPRFDKPVPNIKLKTIFYKEDKIRAIFHRNNKQLGTTNLYNNNYKSLTQKFVDIYQNLEARAEGSATEEQLYKEAIEVLRRDKEVKKVDEEEPISLSLAFREARLEQNKKQEKSKLDIANIFKE
ncbi:probable 28S ribosomal protein S23, mitochondrial [Diabrotica virgifera virgifera]|uniref:Small ribosomal subunit protein mS23 n=1 Tax=Diabrotica virgifera virgifera TaxID=50390 RepID=A0ABM5IIT3_DIAVI|nr:probable 28S ribosomal protein S23, mitochondrial [Diabrotica virgifera virgifera]